MQFTNTIGFDFSYYQESIDFQKVKNYGARFLILRAGFAIYRDKRFDEYMQQSKELLPVSVYHYYDPMHNPIEQAKSLLGIIEPYRNTIRRVWLDLEFYWSGSYESPANWKLYKDTIKAAGFKVGWYTRKEWWDSRVGTYYTEFAKDPVWVAQYYTSLTRIPRGWGNAMIWQNGTPSIGDKVGTTSLEVDYNIWNDDFLFENEWGITDTTKQTYYGVSEVSGTRNGASFILEISDPSKVKHEVFHIDGGNNLSTATTIAKLKGAQTIINGTEYDKRLRSPFYPKLPAISNGTHRIFTDTDNFQPRIGFNTGGFPLVTTRTVNTFHNMTTGMRFLIKDGSIQKYLYDPSDPLYDLNTATEKHSRTIIGLDRNSNIMKLVVSKFPGTSSGLTFYECCQILISYGCVNAFDLGGGGDSVYVRDGTLVNIPDDRDATGNHERPVVQFLLMYAQKENNIKMKYTAKARTDGTRLRDNDHNTVSTFSNTYPLGTMFNGDVLWVATSDVYGVVNGVNTLLNLKGDKWLQVADVNGASKNGWVAIVHKGVIICDIVENKIPATTDGISITITENNISTTYTALGPIVKS